MPSLRGVLPLSVLLLGLAAAPAEATLLVRSDGAGLLIQDKNGLSDEADMFSARVNSRTVYQIRNLNDGDIFKFDRQVGCERDNDFQVTCQRNGPTISVVLAGGSDEFNMAGAPAGESSVAAGAGNDHVIGHVGRDNLNGGTGDDELIGAGGNDSLDGRDGNDRLDGLAGDDTIDGDDGADRIDGSTGRDELRGLAGNDVIIAREPSGTDAVADTVSCGTGTDFVEADLKDFVSASCEARDVAPVGETPNVDIRSKALRVARNGRVGVRMRCPRGVRKLGCKGRLRLRIDGGGASRRVRYAIEAGRRETVTLRLAPRDARRLRRRQRRGKTTRGQLTSVEKGRLGPKTTIRHPRLRPR